MSNIFVFHTVCIELLNLPMVKLVEAQIIINRYSLQNDNNMPADVHFVSDNMQKKTEQGIFN